MKNGIGLALILLISICTLNSVNHSGSDSLLINRIIEGNLTENDLNPDYSANCNRLGIYYYNTNKALIGIELTAEQIDLLKVKNAYSIVSQKIKEEYQKLTITFNQDKQQKTFFLKNEKIISPDSYYKKEMKKVETEYIRFYFSDSERYNQLASDFLNSEIERFLNIFSDFVTKDRIALLKKNKIDYIICSSMQEMQEITGFQTNGIALLNDDTVVSIDPSHMHEITHLLINFVIRDNQLYTHPIFQEGLAVAFGGRSGRSPKTITDSAIYLLQNGFISFDEILSVQTFQNQDASLTYALSGLLNDYLLKTNSPAAYLSLYKKYSVPPAVFPNLSVNKNDLSLDSNWEAYFKKVSKPVTDSVFSTKLLKETSDYRIFLINNTQDKWRIVIKKGVYCFLKDNRLNNYRSRIFGELLPNTKYNGQRYAIKAENDEIILYSLDLDRITYMISNGFSNTLLIRELPDGFLEFETDNQEILKIISN